MRCEYCFSRDRQNEMRIHLVGCPALTPDVSIERLTYLEGFSMGMNGFVVPRNTSRAMAMGWLKGVVKRDREKSGRRN